MNRTPEDLVEAKVMDAARRTLYPPTPDITAAVMDRLHDRRRPLLITFSRAAAILLLAFAVVLLTVPEARAAVLSLLRVGSVTLVRETPIPAPTLDLVPTVLMLDGRTTLEAARQSLPFDLKLPAYPQDLGSPDHVFVPDDESSVLVWMEGDIIRLVLTMHPLDRQMSKYYPWTETGTRVNGDYAAWLTEPHTLFDGGSDAVTRRIIHDHVLIWYDSEVTYRLETDLPMTEAVKIAESLE
jgi:hypothetical protein